MNKRVWLCLQQLDAPLILPLTFSLPCENSALRIGALDTGRVEVPPRSGRAAGRVWGGSRAGPRSTARDRTAQARARSRHVKNQQLLRVRRVPVTGTETKSSSSKLAFIALTTRSPCLYYFLSPFLAKHLNNAKRSRDSTVVFAAL